MSVLASPRPPTDARWLFDDQTVPDLRTPLPGPKGQALLERDARYTSPSYTRVYPLVVDRGSGAVIQDVDGNLFLDFTAGIAVDVHRPLSSARRRGHQGPGRRSCCTCPAPISTTSRRSTWRSGWPRAAPGTSAKRVFFTNSGAEALEAALKLARWHTGRSRAVAFFGAFHGRTYGAMSLSGSKLVHRRGFSPLVPDIHHVPYPRGCHGCDAPDAGCACVRQIEETLFQRASPRRRRSPPSSSSRSRAKAAITCRRRGSCRRCASCATATASCWWPTRCRRGMGRTGKMFAVEHWGVEPDIVCLAKGIASGMPLGAIIARDEVMDWPPRQPRQHLRRQPGQLPGRPGHARPAGGGLHGQRRRARRAAKRGAAAPCGRATPRSATCAAWG